jgi:hypothetical protein
VNAGAETERLSRLLGEVVQGAPSVTAHSTEQSGSSALGRESSAAKSANCGP